MKDKKLLELVRKASKQNKDAFNELCNLKAREVIYLCVVEMGNQHDGEDAAQEVFIRMQKSISSLQAPEAFNVWLNRLVHNTCVNMKRDTMKHKSSIPFETFEDAEWQDDSLFSLPQAFMEDAEKRALVAEAVEALPEKYRRCVVLHYYQSLSYEQVAEVLGITTDAVNNNLRMARKYLKIELEERMRDPMPAAWAALPLVASGPVLALSLQESAIASVSGEMIAGCLAAAGVPAVAAGQAAAGKSATQTLLKVLAPIAATGALAAAVLQLAPGSAPEAPPASVPEPAVSVSAPADPAQPAVLPAEMDETAEVSGTVSAVYGREKSGLSGAQVILWDADGAVYSEATTAADGAFAFDSVPFGSYKLQLTLPGSGEAIWVAVSDGELFTISARNAAGFAGLDIVLDMQSRVSGTLALSLDNRPMTYKEEYLPGVKVELVDPQGKTVAEAAVHGDGRYLFENPPILEQGAYLLRVLVDEVALGEELEVEDIEIELYPGYKC